MITLYNDALRIGSITIDANQFKKWQVEYVESNPNDLPKYEDYFYELRYDTPATDIVFYSIKENGGTIWVNTSIGMYHFDGSGALINYMPVHALEFNFTADGQLIEPNFYHGTRVYHSVSPIRYTYYDESKSMENPRFVVGNFQNGNKTYLTSIFNGLYVYEDGQFISLAENNIWNEKRLRFITRLNDGRKAVTNEDGDVFIINDDSTFKASQIHRDPSHGKTITFLSSYKDFIILGTSQGIVFHNGDREIFMNQEQGVDSKIYNGFVNDGILHLASDHGSYSIQLDAVLNQKNRVDHIGLQSLMINGTEINAAEMINGKINLNHDQNSLDLQLSTNNHPFPGKLKYSYRLYESNSWIELPENKLTLPFLDSGDYQLFVQIDDASTGYKMDQKILEFHIAKPFYKSNLFLAVIFLVSMVILIVYFRFKRKRAYQKALEKESVTKRIEEVKMEALLSQMNPHFIFNSLNSVQYFISNNENDRAMKYLGTFSDLIRSNLHNTERPLNTLEDEIAYLKRYIDLENARFSDRIEVTFIVDPELSLTQTHIPTMILQPFVENAFIHAFPSRIESPQIRIEFAVINSQTYQCTITDNGIGDASFHNNKHHVSKGTQLVRERLSFLGYDPEKSLQISYSQHGTLVRLELER
ncbi:histidine kinase [Nonlabens agnitus]|uniref:Signal transduction histidine kinase internal region domain-containing protein n=1 Tax=Nonlabens agnitus TaxID=870484 RepID=A0A2S9WUQ3_9FLAO|nr:histidine kinase [Nonlabens agnitus]PRP67201.1 hypothetical protein BST86_08860 [Nonlabens agnitus]